MTGRSKQEKQSEADRTAANTAITTAAAPTPLETYQSDQSLATLKDLNSGKDVRDISSLSPYLNLYDSSVADNQDYSGQGLLSQNELSGGNSGQLGLIAKQIAARNKQQAQGQLYNSVQGARANAEGTGLAYDQLQNQKMWNAANAYNSRVGQWIQKPQQPGILSQILGGAATVGAGFASNPALAAMI